MIQGEINNYFVLDVFVRFSINIDSRELKDKPFIEHSHRESGSYNGTLPACSVIRLLMHWDRRWVSLIRFNSVTGRTLHSSRSVWRTVRIDCSGIYGCCASYIYVCV